MCLRHWLLTRGSSVDIIEMTIPVEDSPPQCQKYYPLPNNVREEVRQVLDQMKEFGIIRECKEPSLYVSNLLVTRKKDKDIRVLLDGRLLNNKSIRLPMILVSSMEVYAFLAKKTHVTVLDISNSFFQIPIASKDQPLTCFYSEAHGARYCFERAPQGLKNSPLHLKLLMDKMLGGLAKY